MQPNKTITDLCLWAPKLAYGLIVGVPRVPFIVDVPIQFSSSTVNAPPVVQNFANNLTSDTVVERVSYNLVQPNTFPGSPFQSLYVNQKKQSGATGVGVKLAVFGGPKYEVNSPFTDLGNLIDVFAVAWPSGWLLPKQSNVRIEAILTETPVSVPFQVTISFLGWQMLDKTIDDLSDQEARARLRKLGLVSPDLAILLNP